MVVVVVGPRSFRFTTGNHQSAWVPHKSLRGWCDEHASHDTSRDGERERGQEMVYHKVVLLMHQNHDFTKPLFAKVCVFRSFFVIQGTCLTKRFDCNGVCWNEAMSYHRTMVASNISPTWTDIPTAHIPLKIVAFVCFTYDWLQCGHAAFIWISWRSF